MIFSPIRKIKPKKTNVMKNNLLKNDNLNRKEEAARMTKLIKEALNTIPLICHAFLVRHELYIPLLYKIKHHRGAAMIKISKYSLNGAGPSPMILSDGKMSNL